MRISLMMITYVILIDGFLGPLSNLELIDTNLNFLSQLLLIINGTVGKSGGKAEL